MKEYPTIEYWNKGFFGQYCYAYEKLDGSNLRAGWSPKRGFYKFGARRTMIDENDPILGKGITLFKEKYGESLHRVLHKGYRDISKMVVFFEYFGKNSFAGWHDKNDEHDVIVFDIWSEDHKAFIPPKEFHSNFEIKGGIEVPPLYFSGVYTRNLVHEVRESDLAEGVVIKGGKRDVWMVKAKSNKWFDRLRALKGELALLKEVNGDTNVLEELV